LSGEKNSHVISRNKAQNLEAAKLTPILHENKTSHTAVTARLEFCVAPLPNTNNLIY